MRKKMYHFSFGMLLLLVIWLAGCIGEDENDEENGQGLNGAESVTGTLRAANGDPIPGATVYLPGTTADRSTTRASRTFQRTATAPDGSVCEDPPSEDQALVHTCTSADGTFTLDTSNTTSNPNKIICRKGNLVATKDLDNAAGANTIDFGDIAFDSNASWPKIAVVTGAFDSMEVVLAKLADEDHTDETNGAYGRVDPLSGNFVYGSEYGSNLTIIDGIGSTTPSENTSDLTYQTWESYLDGTNALDEFDVVFINCGNSYEDTALVPNVSVLRNYVNGGGRLYVTDLSYDHIEQAFPEVMQFSGDPADSTTPGELHAAERGTGDLTINAAVNETTMSDWLFGISAIGHDATSAGNPDDDCAYGASDYGIVGTALTPEGHIPLGDFLGGWAHMEAPHNGYDPTIWISSGSGVDFDERVDRPLTISMDIGTAGGKVIYSSYHTVHSCPTTSFWPQERVLQYLIFGSF